MEALTLQKNKGTINKGKLKKNIKNVLCRPDKLLWPEITEDERKRLEVVLSKYRIKIPEFKKPHWKELKLIPKEKRPKPPKLKKVDGLLFGISECSTAIQESQCAAIIIEATMNPRMIAKPIIEMCKTKNVPFLCMTDLRKLTLANFGIKTSCLGLKNECLPDVENEIKDISKIYSKPSKNQTLISCDIANMDVEENKVVKNHSNEMDTSESPYLYRNNKKTRIFVPNAQEISKKITKNFIGQDFIEFSDKVEQTDSKSYMKMILKRISNNADRVKKK